MHPRRLIALLLLVVACLALGRASDAHAGTIIVMNTNDSGTGSLRQAIADAEVGNGILFDVSIQGQTIELHSPIVIDKQLGIDGSTAKMTLKAVSHTRVLEADAAGMNIANINVEGGDSADKGGAILVSTGQFNFHEGSIKNSHADTDGGGIYVVSGASAILDEVVIEGNTAGRDGGGLYAETVSMDLILVTITNNEATGRGGGIFFDQVSTVLQVVTIADNTAAMGGGIFSNAFFGVVGTITGNHASEDGGALYINAGEAVFRNTTISGNSATNGGALEMQPGAKTIMYSGTITDNTGGGLHLTGGTLNIETTIIADQTTAPDCVVMPAATVASNGYNLASDDTCDLNHPTDIERGFANLGPLTLDPGDAYLKTHAPQEGSDALNRIPIDPDASPHGDGPPDRSVQCGVTLAIDARSVLRAQGPGCEIGAYEAIQTKLARIWGDNLCDGEIDADDSLAELAYVAHVPWERVDGCISVGSLVSGDALPTNALPWADVNCDGILNAVDALDGLLASVELPKDNGPACPFIGRDVNLLG
jgi:predicted outer membrane repeat protein